MHATMFGLSHYSDKLGVTLQFAGLASEADDDDARPGFLMSGRILWIR
jgi:hypothetical protein